MNVMLATVLIVTTPAAYATQTAQMECATVWMALQMTAVVQAVSTVSVGYDFLY